MNSPRVQTFSPSNDAIEDLAKRKKNVNAGNYPLKNFVKRKCTKKIKPGLRNV